jgi:hypothetical protein
MGWAMTVFFFFFFFFCWIWAENSVVSLLFESTVNLQYFIIFCCWLMFIIGGCVYEFIYRYRGRDHCGTSHGISNNTNHKSISTEWAGLCKLAFYMIDSSIYEIVMKLAIRGMKNCRCSRLYVVQVLAKRRNVCESWKWITRNETHDQL